MTTDLFDLGGDRAAPPHDAMLGRDALAAMPERGAVAAMPEDGALAAMRHQMVVSQLRPNAVTDQRVVAAMATLPRERFLPADVRGQAYRDTAIPLGEGRFANLPMATARLLNAADLRANDRVLLIGAAGGYTAAVLSDIVASVTAVESLPALCRLAREALADRSTVTLVEAPLTDGAPDGAPYDVLIVDGAIAHVPEAIVAQIRAGGRVAMGVAERGVTRLAAGRRSADGFGDMPFADCDCVVLPGFDLPTGFRF